VITEVVPKRLWACAHKDIHEPHAMEKLIDQGLECVVSILPAGIYNICDIDPKPQVHKVLVCLDNSQVSPERIEGVVSLMAPTLIHCNAGKNRSTAIAACWLIKQCSFIYDRGGNTATIVNRAIDYVIEKRAATFGYLPQVTETMRHNVYKYFKWLRLL